MICGHYPNVAQMDKHPHAEPVADDLGGLPLEPLMPEASAQRHGVHMMPRPPTGDT
jgi:formate dehydrogenase maturation protein FdhE